VLTKENAMTGADEFWLGLTYWPRRSGYSWWQSFDRSEVREDLGRIAGFGCDSVRFCLRWEDFQPTPDRLNSAAMRSFERALDTAGDAGLRVIAALFPVAIGGWAHVPRWASRVDPAVLLQEQARPRAARRANGAAPRMSASAAGPPVIYEGGYHASDARDLFGDPAVREAQRYLVREVVGYFGQHPALAAWQLGEGFERVRRPDPAAVADWFGELADLTRSLPGAAPVLGLTSAEGLLHAAGPRPDNLAATCDLVGVALETSRPSWERTPLKTGPAAFTHVLAAALAERAVFVTNLGQPTAPEGQTGIAADSAFGRSVHIYRAHQLEQAEFLTRALERLWRAGARGVLLADYADYPAELWRVPPLDRSIGSRSLGLVDATGREKPAADAVRSFAAAHASRNDGATLALDLDPQRYWRAPRQEYTRLKQAFMSDIGDE
jgi:hypothetical protein